MRTNKKDRRKNVTFLSKSARLHSMRPQPERVVVVSSFWHLKIPFPVCLRSISSEGLETEVCQSSVDKNRGGMSNLTLFL